LGSGAKGWVVIDSSCPELVVRTDPLSKAANPTFKILKGGGPEPGLKSIDWWGAIKSDPDFSAIGWTVGSGGTCT